MGPRRLRPPGVVPLELWDLELGAGILWDHMEGAALPTALVEAIEKLRRGTARTRSRIPIPACARELRAVWLAGGRAHAIDATAMSTALGLPVRIAPDPTAHAEHGARALVPEAARLAVVDLGQSCLKVFLDGRRFEHPRPWDRLPLRAQASASERELARSTLRQWVGEALGHAAAGGAPPDVVVLALPCALPDTSIPGSSSYLGLEGDAAFIPAVLAVAGWSSASRVLVLNDAELAAVAAGLDPRTRDTITLVLTLGFGVGGALRRP